ncbi:MAG: SusC/RagA family TonB-linked outer membrane protein [Dysgonomonas sp.]|jgi:TonB-linked SusC/RagA family outer membrane protein|uniref:SusC/RagA family TonB-linked outer membrane protein n=1 Tax=unclassified Dysgonomonas TaxID=2630389 RepID=UPI0025C6ECFA|nr:MULTISPECIES: TonB-dependent receptor [unclassified Dysgonomonas]MDR1715171.1 TonB-dependent receptor [Prevotella sp.]HMM04965.1 TonB-dependent receptor [Dysgonomonas sp.]
MKKRVVLILSCLLLSIGYIAAQTTKISGTVVDELGEPAIGASVVVKGTSTGTITDVNGNFSLNVSADKKTLVISLIGMKTKEVAAGTNLKITLENDSQLLDEVMVVAYGTAKKSSFTGSASVVNSDKISSRPITSALSAIEGNATGVQVSTTTGQPGESVGIRIRGFGSVNASNAPLYILDGSIYNGNLASINPSDIESMTILKDAASTSLYGSSAGNGVVLITTKKGRQGAGVTLNVTQGWSNRAYADYAKVDAYEYYPLQWQMLKNSGVTSGKSQAEAAEIASRDIVSTLKYNPFVGIADGEVVGLDGKLNPAATKLKWADDLDFEDAAFGNGYRQEYSLGYNSKTDKSDTYSSISYLDEKGYMMKTNFNRMSARLNHNINPVKWFKSGVNLAYARSQSNYSSSTQSSSSSYSNLTRFVRVMAPIYPVHRHDLNTGAYLDAAGNPTTNPKEYIWDYSGARLSGNGRDALAETDYNSRQFNRNDASGRTYITLTPITNLTLTANYSIDGTDYRARVYENPLVGDGTAGPGRLSLTSTRSTTQTLNQLIGYNKSIDKHHIDVLAGHETYIYSYEYLYSMKVGEIFSGVHEFPNFTTISSVSSYTDTYKKEGYLARLNYDYDNKYYGSFSYRHDGTSRFSKDSRWGDFWSYGASWRISEEKFMQDINWVDNLKLRVSYGETGVDRTLDADGNNDYYPYQTLYDLGINNGPDAGVYFSTLSNKNLVWETQISKDAALEFALFGKLSGTIEYFQKDSKDLLFNVHVPTSTGASSQLQNIGKVRNSGIELDVNYQVFKNSDWAVNIGANATRITNKILKMPDENKENGLIDGSKKLMEGSSIYEFWLRQWYGVDPANGDGLYLLDTDAYNKEKGTLTAAIEKTVQEINGVPVTNSYSYAKYDFSGTAIPKWFGGFNFNVAYKAFSLGAVFSYQLGGKTLDNIYLSMMDMANYGYAMSVDVRRAWQAEGDVTDVPRLDKTAAHNTNVGQSYSTRWLVSTDYLNLRSVNLSYTLPKNLLNKVQIRETKLTFNAENLFMLKARQGLNPQQNFNGITYNVYMPARTFTLGLNMSF